MTELRLNRILIVEDDAMVRRLLSRHLAKSGATIMEAAEAEEGLRLFSQAQEPFDVVVSDVHLPGKSGLDMATEMRMLRPQQPIVFVTGDVDERLARRALAGGKAGYLLKPFEFFELDAAVAQAVQNAEASAQPSSLPDSQERWLADQRRLLLAAAERPVDVNTFARHQYRARMPLGLWIKLAAAVVVLVGLALLIGYGMMGEPQERPDPAAQPQQTGERTIYVPYEPPQRERSSRDKQR